ncbi:MAG: DNA-binding protein [Geobacter sp.]|nr:DNA-binding protein [Geobacter sp.]
MNKGRFSPIIPLAVFLNCLFAATAFAGFGFGSDDVGKSGLDFNRGYDINTVTTVSGRVVSAPRTNGNEHVFVEVRTDGEIISLSLGPKYSWVKKEFPLHPNDEIAARGSKAQGEDGKSYLMVQKLTNLTTGARMVVRNERGEPGWSARTAGSMMSNGPRGGMMWGGGMMRH